MNLPAHVLEHIAATTGIDHTVVSRKARRDHCRRCGGQILRGLDADLIASDTRIDPVPLTPLGEMVARRAGLGTWTLSPVPPGLAINIRDEAAFSLKPAGTIPRTDIVPGHQCGRQWFPGCLTTSHLPKPPTISRNDEPPF